MWYQLFCGCGATSISDGIISIIFSISITHIFTYNHSDLRPTGHVLYDELCGQLGPRAIPPDQWQRQKWGKFFATLNFRPILGQAELDYVFGDSKCSTNFGDQFWQFRWVTDCCLPTIQFRWCQPNLPVRWDDCHYHKKKIHWFPPQVFGMRGSDIDKYSRVIFPIMFLSFHLVTIIPIYLELIPFIRSFIFHLSVILTI